MKRILTSLAVSCTLLLATCNEDEPIKLEKITLDSVNVMCGLLPRGFYNSVQMVSPMTGYATTTTGTISKTTNGGNSWVQVSGTATHLRNMFFVDELTGFVVGDSDEGGVILKTLNGGESWELKSFPEINGLIGVHFINHTVGFCSGSNTLLKTTDGGNTWLKVQLAEKYRLGEIHFFDERIGLISARPASLKTTDGGTTWKELTNKNIQGNIQFINRKTIYVQLGHMLHKTQDGGSSWSSLYTLPSMNSLHFINEYQGVAGGYYYCDICFAPTGTIYVTNDGGKNWDKMYVDKFYQLVELSFTNDSTAIAVGQTAMGCVVQLKFSK